MFLLIKLVYSIIFLSFYCVQASQKIDDIIIVRGVKYGGPGPTEDYLQFTIDKQGYEDKGSFCLAITEDLGQKAACLDENHVTATAIALNDDQKYVGVIFSDGAAKILYYHTQPDWAPGMELYIDPQHILSIVGQVNFFSPIELCNMASDLDALRKEEITKSVESMPFKRIAQNIDEIAIIDKYHSYRRELGIGKDIFLRSVDGYYIFTSNQNKRFFIPHKTLFTIIEYFDNGKLPMAVMLKKNLNTSMGLIFTSTALQLLSLWKKQQQSGVHEEDWEHFKEEDYACDDLVLLDGYSVEKFCNLLPDNKRNPDIVLQINGAEELWSVKYQEFKKQLEKIEEKIRQGVTDFEDDSSLEEYEMRIITDPDCQEQKDAINLVQQQQQQQQKINEEQKSRKHYQTGVFTRYAILFVGGIFCLWSLYYIMKNIGNYQPR